MEANESDLGQTVISIGSLKGKKFSEVSLDHLDSLIGWLETAKLYKDKFKDLYDKIVRYLEDNNYGENEEPQEDDFI